VNGKGQKQKFELGGKLVLAALAGDFNAEGEAVSGKNTSGNGT